jgi:hypothetical protein
MSDLIIVRLHPEKPTNGASFTGYLTDLTITVSDMSVANPQGVNNPIGTAFYSPADPTSTIVQHNMPVPPLPPTSPLAAVATAVIVINPAKELPAYREYVTSDLRLSITRGTQTIVDQSMNYNVGVETGTNVPPNHDPGKYATLGPVALYLALPDPGVGLDANRAFVNVPTNGSPPSYDELLAAVQKVYAQDPGGVFDIDSPPLTAAQARHIANEILGNRQLNPLPAPPDPLENLYTLDKNGNPVAPDTDRQQFESDLTAYYTTMSTQAEVLAGYVFALSTALVCEKKTTSATNAGFELPVLPGIVGSSGKTTETDVILSG